MAPACPDGDSVHIPGRVGTRLVRMVDTAVETGPGGRTRVLMTLDSAEHDPDAPLLHADDLAVLRGDGVFETLLVRGGHARLVDEHLQRLERSARLLQLPPPDLSAWRRTVAAAAQRWGGSSEATMRLVYTRGREGSAVPTAFVLVSAVPSRTERLRDQGIAVITLDRGRSVDVADAAPWELAGAKSLSYATNMAALRHAEKQGADDVVFVSAEGYVLEGPRSTVVIARGGELITPPTRQGILPGTTQHALFETAGRHGMTCREEALRPADLIAADGVWLVSSVMLVGTVRTVNGVEIGQSTLDAKIRTMVAEGIGDGTPEDARHDTADTEDADVQEGSSKRKASDGEGGS